MLQSLAGGMHGCSVPALQLAKCVSTAQLLRTMRLWELTRHAALAGGGHPAFMPLLLPLLRRTAAEHGQRPNCHCCGCFVAQLQSPLLVQLSLLTPAPRVRRRPAHRPAAWSPGPRPPGAPAQTLDMQR